MAIVKFGTIVTGIRKTLGGITFSASGAGNCVKAWARSTMPKTPKQTAQQSLLATITALWNTIDPTDRAMWPPFALAPPETDTNSLGHVYFLSGFQWFIRSNSRNYLASEPFIPQPPTSGAVAPPTSVTLAASSGPPLSVVISFDSAPFAVHPYAAPQIAFSRGSGSQTKYSGYYSTPITNVSGTTSLDVSAPALALFGNIRPGDTLWITLRVQSTDGVRSPLTSASAIVT